MSLPWCVEMNSANVADVSLNQVVSMIEADSIWLWENADCTTFQSENGYETVWYNLKI